MKKIIPIINLAIKFAAVNRTVGYRDGHFENDAEHSYQLALVCWSVNEQYQLGLRDELLLKFALVHDLVEVYTGDVDAYDNPQQIADKQANEERAFAKLKTEYTQFADMLKTIERYETKKDMEAQLVFVMDKFLVDANIYHSKGSYYRSRKISIDVWKKWLLNKINYKTLNPRLKPLVDESINEIEINFSEIFYKTAHRSKPNHKGNSHS